MYQVFEEPYPFEDEAKPSFGFKRHREGTSRRTWNADPMWRYDAGPLKGTQAPVCASCGYREHRINMTRLDGLSELQRLLDKGEVVEPLYCLACYLLETKPERYDKFWADYEALIGKKPDPLKGTRNTLEPLPANFGTGRKR